MKVASDSDRSRTIGKANLNANVSERCQYCSARCGGNNKCGSTPNKK